MSNRDEMYAQRRDEAFRGCSWTESVDLFERMGIAESIKAKVTRPESDVVSQLVARGEVELGLVVSTRAVLADFSTPLILGSEPPGRACNIEARIQQEFAMKKMVPLLVAAVACSFSQLASAVPIRATFDGTVSGSSGFFDTVLSDFPVGTTASFDVTFDDSGLVDDAAAINDFDVGPVSGWVRMGSLEWLLDAGFIYTYSYLAQPGNPVVSYGLQLTGTGPTIAGGSASIFGLFLSLTPDATPFSGHAPMMGFRYPFEGGEFYSYADLSGNFSTSRETTSAPEPPTGLLMCSALALLAWLRRRQVRAARSGD